MTKWRNEDIEKLKEIYPTASEQELKDTFKREMNNIRQKAWKLDINRDKKVTSKIISDLKSGSNNPRWNGGIKHHSSGYIYVLDKERTSEQSTNYIGQHRLVMERELGRRLEPDEAVHHLDEVKNNNEPDNLQVMDNYEHIKLHAKKRRKRA